MESLKAEDFKEIIEAVHSGISFSLRYDPNCNGYQITLDKEVSGRLYRVRSIEPLYTLWEAMSPMHRILYIISQLIIKMNRDISLIPK